MIVITLCGVCHPGRSGERRSAQVDTTANRYTRRACTQFIIRQRADVVLFSRHSHIYACATMSEHCCNDVLYISCSFGGSMNNGVSAHRHKLPNKKKRKETTEGKQERRGGFSIQSAHRESWFASLSQLGAAVIQSGFLAVFPIHNWGKKKDDRQTVCVFVYTRVWFRRDTACHLLHACNGLDGTNTRWTRRLSLA